MNILGISAYYHDSAACLVRDGEIIAAAQEERFTRIKHDNRFPVNAIASCLDVADIRTSDLDVVAFYDKPWLKFERLVQTYLAFAPCGLKSFMAAMPLWLKEKLWIGEKIRKQLGGYNGRLIYPEHHQSHAASAFFPSPFDSAAILTIDGVGEWATASWGAGTNNHIEIKQELHFPHSLGLLYSAFTYYCGFKVNSGEYKMMGLAPYGKPNYKDLIYEHVVDIKPDGSIFLNMEYFNYGHGLTMTSEKFHHLFGGPPRRPDSEITQKDMDIASSIQAVTEDIILRMARYVRKETGESNLCLAGGVALNCVANGRVLAERIFNDIWIQPAAGDAGGALGAALFAWYQCEGNPRDTGNAAADFQKGSLLGPQFDQPEILKWLDKKGCPYDTGNSEEIIDRVAQAIADGNVVGWFSGRMEFGPRALGSRSILGDPRNADMQSLINRKIKFRESFRPFAPAVLAEDASEYFSLETASPYMLVVAGVCNKHRLDISESDERLTGVDMLRIRRSDIPAVTHVDYSARIQTVDKKTNPRFHQLLSRFRQITGYGVLINTSFNIRGEPIVCSLDDAYHCFMKTGMDILVLENTILYKKQQPGGIASFAPDHADTGSSI